MKQRTESDGDVSGKREGGKNAKKRRQAWMTKIST